MQEHSHSQYTVVIHPFFKMFISSTIVKCFYTRIQSSDNHTEHKTWWWSRGSSRTATAARRRRRIKSRKILLFKVWKIGPLILPTALTWIILIMVLLHLFNRRVTITHNVGRYISGTGTMVVAVSLSRIPKFPVSFVVFGFSATCFVNCCVGARRWVWDKWEWVAEMEWENYYE